MLVDFDITCTITYPRVYVLTWLFKEKQKGFALCAIRNSLHVYNGKILSIMLAATSWTEETISYRECIYAADMDVIHDLRHG